MKRKTSVSQSTFPARKWAKTSTSPMCSNPNCCTRNNALVSINNADSQKPMSRQVRNVRVCAGGEHNEHCCREKNNKTCSPEQWKVLYKLVEPEWEDLLRREWMTRWTKGECKLHEAVLGFEAERDACLGLERRVAA